MHRTRERAPELGRLKRVQARVRKLAQHAWFADAIRGAFVMYLQLAERHDREQSDQADRARRLAGDVLKRGWLLDPDMPDRCPVLYVPIKGLCPVSLAEQLRKYAPGDPMTRTLQQEGATAALAALERSGLYRALDLPEPTRKAMRHQDQAALDAKTHCEHTWRIGLPRPVDWQEVPNPRSLQHRELMRFGEAERLVIALHVLGALADVGALSPIVPEPTETGDRARDRRADAEWRLRLPIDDDELDQNQPSLCVEALAPEVAEQLLEFVQTWAKREAAARGELLAASGLHRSPELLRRTQSDAAAVVGTVANDLADERAAEKVARVFGGDDTEGGGNGPPRTPAEADDDAYRPATWFPKRMAARLRMAAHKSRKTKRVATRKIDGTVFYLVADARRWWPTDVPDERKKA